MHVYIGMGNITSLPFALGHNSSKYSGDSFGYSCSIVRKVLHRLHPSKNVFPTAQLVGDDSNDRGIWKFKCQFLMLLRSAYVAHTGSLRYMKYNKYREGDGISYYALVHPL